MSERQLTSREELEPTKSPDALQGTDGDRRGQTGTDRGQTGDRRGQTGTDRGQTGTDGDTDQDFPLLGDE